jgi:hypothetical protein
MLESNAGMGMLRLYLALFQLFIFLNRMPSMLTLPNAVPGWPRCVRARVTRGYRSACWACKSEL